jgi:excisionase family DNA binding protein
MNEFYFKLNNLGAILPFTNPHTNVKMQPTILKDIKILTIQEVAETLRIHRSTVSRLAKSGELKSYLIGKRRLFKETDVWAFFENQRERGYAFVEED